VTPETAQREITSIAAALAQEHPATDGAFSLTAVPLRADLMGDTRTPLLVLMASAVLVLLIACANLAGALLARTLSRRKEFAVRAALGAGGGRIVRQLLAESLLLSLAGGAAGVVLATLGLTVVRTLARGALPAYASLSLDPGALLFAFTLALVTGLAFGLAPALSVRRAGARPVLQEGTRASTEGSRSHHLRSLLVAGQIALSISLVTGAGLLARSLWAMTATPLGFDPHGVLTVPLQLPASRYRAAARVQLVTQLEERLRALPGVRSVATTTQLPMPGMGHGTFTVEGAAWPAGVQPFVAVGSASEDYFRTMRIVLRAGRSFTTADRDSAPNVVVISESMARRFWPNGGAIGALIQLAGRTDAPWRQVVGIVGDVRNDRARREPEPMLYLPLRQSGSARPTLVIRSAGDPMRQSASVRRIVAALDPTLPTDQMETLDRVIANGLASRRLPVVLMAAFGTLALLLAAVGVYAMFAAMAAAREREFGVRVALGSSRRAIASLILRQAGICMAIGLAGGAVGVVAITHLVRGLLYGVSRFDMVAIGAAVLLLLVCGALALVVPIRRATRVDPINALR
jgi:predicted permease